MLTFALQSGSNGNAIYVEAAGVRLLFDAGVSGRQAKLRMAAHQRRIGDVDALIISHEHGDHIRAAGIYQRLFGLPIHMTRATHRANRCQLGKLSDVYHFTAGDMLEFGPVRVHTIRTPHDAADTVMFIVEGDGRRLGIFTDLGHPFGALARALEEVDAAYLESNYDPRMLASGPYPERLRERIRGAGGHLSNHESADLVAGCGRKRPSWVALAHLSEQNNHPDIALDTHHTHVGRSFPFELARRDRASNLWVV